MTNVDRRLCVISMVHVDRETETWMQEQAIKLASKRKLTDPNPTLPISATDHGYVLYVGTGDRPNEGDAPLSLQLCMRYARKRRCEWLELDVTGAFTPILPSYER